MAQPMAVPYSEFADADGAPLAGGKVYTYEAGTTTPKASFTDSSGTVPASNPVILDAAGRATIWLSGYYKITVTDANDVVIRTTDNVSALGATGDMNSSVYDPAGIQQQVVGTTAVQTLTNKTLTNPTIASVNTGQLAGFRNGVINGAFDVWQRNTTFTPTDATHTYTADRWGFYRNVGATANYTIAQQTGPDGSQFCARVQRTAASSSTAAIQMAQSFELNNTARYRNKKCTVRFKARSGANYSATGSALACVVTTGTTANQSYLPAGYTGQANAIVQNATLTTSWQTFSFTSTAVVGASINAIAVAFTFTPVGTAGAADYFEISEIELVEGDVASTYFERLDYATVLLHCLRYYEKSFVYATAPAQNAGTTGAYAVYLPTGATGTFGTSIVMQPKRTAPTITTYNPSAANANWRDTTNSADRTVTVGDVGENSFVVSGAAGAAASANRIHWAAAAEL